MERTDEVDINRTAPEFKGRLRHVCEVCGRTEILTPQEAFDEGWDYPPRMGSFGIVSPRTCPDCSMMDTAWAALTLEGKSPDELTERQKQTILRIVSEPESIVVREEE